MCIMTLEPCGRLRLPESDGRTAGLSNRVPRRWEEELGDDGPARPAERDAG